VRAVEDDPDDGAVLDGGPVGRVRVGRDPLASGGQRLGDADVASLGIPGAVVGERLRRLEAVAANQQRVAEEAQQLGGVLDSAVAEVGVGLGDDARGDGRSGGQLGVGLGLAAERERAWSRSKPDSQARRPPSRRTRTTRAPSVSSSTSAAGSGCWAGLTQRTTG
jgi:hypothetical protein